LFFYPFKEKDSETFSTLKFLNFTELKWSLNSVLKFLLNKTSKIRNLNLDKKKRTKDTTPFSDQDNIIKTRFSSIKEFFFNTNIFIAVTNQSKLFNLTKSS